MIRLSSSLRSISGILKSFLQFQQPFDELIHVEDYSRLFSSPPSLPAQQRLSRKAQIQQLGLDHRLYVVLQEFVLCSASLTFRFLTLTLSFLAGVDSTHEQLIVHNWSIAELAIVVAAVTGELMAAVAGGQAAPSDTAHLVFPLRAMVVHHHIHRRTILGMVLVDWRKVIPVLRLPVSPWFFFWHFPVWRACVIAEHCLPHTQHSTEATLACGSVS